ncbi:MAG: acetyltransferase [Candidatus Nanopelagicales bacterium]
MSSRKAVVVGAGGHAVSVAESIHASGLELVAFTSDDASVTTLLGRPVLREVPQSHLDAGGIVVVAVGDNASRERAWRALADRLPLEQLPALVHSSAVVASNAQVGAGSVILQGAVVGSAARVGTGCLLNSGSILEHECVMEEFSSLAPGAVLGGRVRVGRRAAVSIGATVKHGLTIGEDTVVGAASYVHDSLPARVVAFGVPARVVRERREGDPYLG